MFANQTVHPLWSLRTSVHVHLPRLIACLNVSLAKVRWQLCCEDTSHGYRGFTRRCEAVPVRRCHEVPAESCDTVEDTRCDLVPGQQCHTVNTLHCHMVPDEVTLLSAVSYLTLPLVNSAVTLIIFSRFAMNLCYTSALIMMWRSVSRFLINSAIYRRRTFAPKWKRKLPDGVNTNWLFPSILPQQNV